MLLNVKDLNTGSESNLTVSDHVFGSDYNEPLVHQVVVALMASLRAGTKAQKTRSEVSGGGKKPWKQKGTGRARAGTIRSPIWRKGGVIFAAKPRGFKQKVNRKMFRAATVSVLSELNRQNRLHVVNDIHLDSHKTKDLLSILAKLNLNDALIIVDTVSENLFLASRNVPNVFVCEVCDVNPVNLLQFKNVVMTSKAISALPDYSCGAI